MNIRESFTKNSEAEDRLATQFGTVLMALELLKIAITNNEIEEIEEHLKTLDDLLPLLESNYEAHRDGYLLSQQIAKSFYMIGLVSCISILLFDFIPQESKFEIIIILLALLVTVYGIDYLNDTTGKLKRIDNTINKIDLDYYNLISTIRHNLSPDELDSNKLLIYKLTKSIFELSKQVDKYIKVKNVNFSFLEEILKNLSQRMKNTQGNIFDLYDAIYNSLIDPKLKIIINGLYNSQISGTYNQILTFLTEPDSAKHEQ